jgi:hypothetical protein
LRIFFYNYSSLILGWIDRMMMERKTLSTLAMLVSLASMLMCSCISPQVGAASPQGYAPASVEAVATHAINITGEVVDVDGFLIVSEFIAVAENSGNGKRVISEAFYEGRFQLTLYVPGFADDNQTIDIQVLSPDQQTVYGNKSLLLANLNETYGYPIVIKVANPPPNYSWLILIICVVIFSLILAGYILFTKWLVGQAVLRRADEIMIKRRMGEENFDENSVDEADDEEDSEGEKDEESGE